MEEVAWEMRGKMNPTEVQSVGRRGGCAGYVLIYFQKLLPALEPIIFHAMGENER